MSNQQIGSRSCLAAIPARNEQDTVGEVVRGVMDALNCAVLVINDASTDDTAAAAAAAGATVVTLPFQLGAWGAAQAGMRYALRNHYERVVTLDADGQHHPDQLPQLLQAHMAGGADVTIGTCPQRLSAAKRVAWAYFRLITGLQVTDFTSGLRVYGHRAIRALASREASLIDYQDIGVLMLLRRKALRIAETPTIMSARRSGASRIFSSWFTVARYMIATTVLGIARIGARERRTRSEAATP
ncbi:MAG TPA: glycosyltransferase family 2 protein [Tahibacter sp.]|uniref:glycosyltransferase family 2 protein n=1 Tax=Tahibacter sp. TaxID=2056211 RepID=UPI002BCE87D7|nr:glycosyltransferase family 2 protein [Tahibacter sp.]HSX61184.1 glycosyltransferase family 2 protein [Tahibacter sp.]